MTPPGCAPDPASDWTHTCGPTSTPDKHPGPRRSASSEPLPSVSFQSRAQCSKMGTGMGYWATGISALAAICPHPPPPPNKRLTRRAHPSLRHIPPFSGNNQSVRKRSRSNTCLRPSPPSCDTNLPTRRPITAPRRHRPTRGRHEPHGTPSHVRLARGTRLITPPSRHLAMARPKLPPRDGPRAAQRLLARVETRADSTASCEELTLALIVRRSITCATFA